NSGKLAIKPSWMIRTKKARLWYAPGPGLFFSLGVRVCYATGLR
ncbi:MAG: hypothetical protein ACI87O_001359, partial [Planctomycetota bacterium]